MKLSYRQQICEQIRHMRDLCVEPELIHMSLECYRILGKPRRLMGVPVDCDRRMDRGFEVR